MTEERTRRPAPGAPSKASLRGRRGAGPAAGSWPARAAAGVVIAAALAAGGSVVWNRIAQVQRGTVVSQIPQGVQHDPATRARGAVLSISGPASGPRTSYDPASGTVSVRFQSKYFDPAHSAALNRQYLATEGRLVVQLVLYNDPEVGRAVAALYRGGRLLAIVTGAPGQAYAEYTVEYAKGLP